MRHLSSITLCLIGCLITGRALDISDVTLINPDPVVSSVNLPSLRCVSSDWTVSGTGSLSLGHEYPDQEAHVLSTEPDRSHHSAAKITWMSRNHTFGAFYCQLKNSSRSKIYTYKMLHEAAFLPESLTITVNEGEDVNISYSRKTYLPEDTVIYKNGNFEHSSPKEDIMDVINYPIINAKAQSHAGIYAIRYISEAPFSSAITRLIVRSCKAGLWGADCMKSCLSCANGGVCDDVTGECICPPGFKGPTCETVCGEGRFGRSCKERCVDGVCRSLLFCLRDPYGCSCASGWRGFNCSEACPAGYYGADCKQKCECEQSKCSRFRGCVCEGRHGARCQKPDTRPVIVSSLRDIELNSGITYTVNCSASGQPAPLHGEITLVKPDKTTVYAVDTQTENDQTTSAFRVEKITVSAAGRWSCQVKTKHYQEEKEFIVNVKVPPQPQNPPLLNDSGPHHLLLLLNKEPYAGDGPVTSVKLIYKQNSSSTWRSIEASGSLVRLDNLSPMTQYTAQVQLSRHGLGGTGQPGPEAIFSTQMLEVPVGVKLSPISQTVLLLSWDAAPAEEDWSYEVTCQQVGASGTERRFQLASNSSDLHLNELKPRHKYQCNVMTSSSAAGQACPTVSAWTLSDQLPPPPANISTCNISDSSAVITWLVAEGHSISRAMIRYQQTDYSQQVELGVQDQTNMHFQLRGLREDTTYQLELWSVNNMGESVERPQITLKTLMPQESSQLHRFQAHGNMLFYAILGSAGMTCITILLAFCIVLQLKRATFQRHMVQAFHNIVREEPVVQFSSMPLNVPKKVPSSSQSVAYPTLEWSDIKFQDVIGEGNFGQVLKARIKKDGLRMDAAIKRMKEYASKDDHRDFAGELEVLCKLGHHPNIINLLGACEHRGYLYLAIEYAPHGNLLDFLRKSRVLETDPAFAIANSTASTLSSQQLLHFAADVAHGMDYLSQKQFIHRDLAARNILVGENFVAKIADFGLSRGQEVYVKKTMGHLPVRWMAIESLNYSVYTTNSDVWNTVLRYDVRAAVRETPAGLSAGEAAQL
ncbi:tyrosine-protein kinase receptor Tie-2-like [Sinocyclocheilus anshuiensis]|uniref:tyrosine-protein kinase receptor Tie-2-like n=1 Tax=Sinocyclocheilus anshuiensis TaxID=1608454 RepID=UPI0007BA6903|nr:PREDICTED: tyrosine-protein kinase receptor Tie-2-like [Sinocyclocheilus anshuiensis]XP_016339989.1 PREDICTED: tyrosine-protein kinase receptor Tie-2-like [Sinocyclocheilus anshuiensis]